MTSSPLHVVTALRIEGRALRGRLGGARLSRCGMGPDRVREWLPQWDDRSARAIAVAGVAGGLNPTLRPGDVVVANEVRDADGRIALRAAAPLVAELRRCGLRVHVGPVVSIDHAITHRDERERLVRSGASVVDMESAAVVRGVRARNAEVPIAVVRVVADTALEPLLSPRTLVTGSRALLALRRIGPALTAWAELAGRRRRVLLAGPRSFCAGVERAIDVVERALQRCPHPVYVRRQIVHNAHVVADLERRGAVFVDELDQVPDGATVVFSAHGVAPAVRAEADRRELTVVDATCPLVGKVHAEARRFVGRGKQVLLVGHAGHDEVEGTLGEAPGQITLIENVADAERVAVADADRVAFVLQTTLGMQDAAATVATLRRRFPSIESSPSDDICYATTNRQRAVTDIADDCDVVLVIGSTNSSNSLRLVEIAAAAGVPAHLLDDVTELDPRWLADAETVGITAGASAPPHLVDELVATLAALGPVQVEERAVTTENVTFSLPRGVSD